MRSNAIDATRNYNGKDLFASPQWFRPQYCWLRHATIPRWQIHQECHHLLLKPINIQLYSPTSVLTAISQGNQRQPFPLQSSLSKCSAKELIKTNGTGSFTSSEHKCPFCNPIDTVKAPKETPTSGTDLFFLHLPLNS